jgi:hypothetical protein
MSERAQIFGDDADFDVSAFAPKTAPKKDAAPEEAVRAVAEQAAFTSREPAPPKQRQKKIREPRQHRTGRNVQINVKARAEAVTAFYKISDDENWVLGETFERAMEALKRELAAEPNRPS